jgi:hypothetical protein
VPRSLVGCFWLLLCQAASFASALPFAGETIAISVTDSSRLPISGARVQLKTGDASAVVLETGPDGLASFVELQPGRYQITVTKEGFETALKSDLDVPQPSSTGPIPLILIPAAKHESVNVTGTASPVEQGSSAPSELSPQVAKEMPSRPATVADALPLVPGVVRKPDGGIQISASPEHRSSMIVNSADVTDPATGQFGLTVPIDSVETINVYQAPFRAEYGRFTAGLVSVETRRGGDKWKWEINDPFPDFYIRSYHLRGLRDATPRFNVEGPIIEGKLFFSEGFEYEVRKVQVHTLPFPNDQKKNEGVNSFAQIDWIASSKQLVTATVHLAPQRMSFVNLDYFNPPETTPDASTHNYTATLADKLTIFGGVLDNTMSATRFTALIWGRGDADLVMTPQGNTGSYFEGQNRAATRIAWAPVYSLAPIKLLGTHEFKVGAYLGSSSDQGEVSEHPIDILDSNNRMTEQITFFGGRAFEMDDTEYAVFLQDHWTISPRFAVDLGGRLESQQVSGSLRVAPRAGLAWSPFAKLGTVIRAGFGLFYDRVPLNVYAFNHYPKQIVTYFDPQGNISEGPYFYLNTLNQVDLHIPLVFKRSGPGNFSPQSMTGSLQVEQPLTSRINLRLGYMQSQSDGLVILDSVPPDPVTNLGANELSGNGLSRYRQLEVTTRVKLSAKQELFFSYVRSRARGDLNDFGTYLGSFPIPIVRPNQYGNLSGDLPNRFLAWGTIQLPQGFRISPVIEYRNGFPYASTDAMQNYYGIPNEKRYPNFMSVDSRLSKDIKVSPKYTVRLSVSDFNLTNHFNPEALHSNIGDPAYGLFFGQRGRRFTADFDVLF